MAAGQGLLAQGVLPPSVAVLEARLAAGCEARHAVHAQLLTDALALLRAFRVAGQELSVPAELARVWRCSEMTAGALLDDAELLGSLPGAIECLAAGVLTVEQSRAVRLELEPLSAELRLAVWEQLRERLESDFDAGVPPTPGRARELIRRQVRRLDPAGVAQRRRQACRDRAEVDVWRDPDGLVDLRLTAVSPPLAQAALLRIRALSAPIGPSDERTAGQRRRDAAIDLLLGRACLPLGDDSDNPADGSSARCGCGAGHPVPCGAQVTVLVPLATALGTDDEPAELLGHGALDPDLLDELLLSGPELSVVFVDEHGTPVADNPTVLTPARGDPAALRDALLHLADTPPGPHQPRHPDDHSPPERFRPPDPPEGIWRIEPLEPLEPTEPTEPTEADEPAIGPATTTRTATAACRVTGPPVRPVGPKRGGHPHPPGPYQVPARLRRFLQTRAPRCEWPGCTIRAVTCDQDHDLAWPDGPTCPCNLGSLCRRHHRTKQCGWTKTRRGDGTITWTSPTGATSTTPTRHPAPAHDSRPLPELPAERTIEQELQLLADLGCLQAEHDLADLAPGAAWLHGSEPSDQLPDDTDPVDTDSQCDELRYGRTTWTLDLDDHTQWQPAEHAAG